MATSVAKQREDAIVAFRRDLYAMKDQFLMVMPKRMTDRFMRTAMTALQEKPELVDCDPRLVIGCLMKAAQDNLLPDGIEGAIVLYEGKPRWQPMYKGDRTAVMRSGLIRDINVQPVFDGDEFEFELGDPDRAYIHHRPSLAGGRTRKLIACYSIAIRNDGGISRHVMGLDEILQIASKSRAKKGPWHDPIFFSEMARKTCLKAHCKQLPTNRDIETVFARDHDLYNLDGEDRVGQPQRRAVPPGSAKALLEQFGDGGNGSSKEEDAAGDKQRDDAPSGDPREDAPPPPPPEPAPPPPQNAEQYRQFAERVIDAAEDGTALQAWWNSSAQRRMRNSCAVTKDRYDALFARIQTRLEALLQETTQ